MTTPIKLLRAIETKLEIREAQSHIKSLKSSPPSNMRKTPTEIWSEAKAGTPPAFLSSKEAKDVIAVAVAELNQGGPNAALTNENKSLKTENASLRSRLDAMTKHASAHAGTKATIDAMRTSSPALKSPTAAELASAMHDEAAKREAERAANEPKARALANWSRKPGDKPTGQSALQAWASKPAAINRPAPSK